MYRLPSGKRLHNYGKIHHFQWGKSPCYQWVNPLFLWSFSIAMLVYQRLYFQYIPWYSNKSDYHEGYHLSTKPPVMAMGPVFIPPSPPSRLLPPAALGALSGLVVVVLLQSNTQEKKPWHHGTGGVNRWRDWWRWYLLEKEWWSIYIGLVGKTIGFSYPSWFITYS
jgi:hypothetical protein